MVAVQHFDAVGFRDVTGSDDTRTLGVDRHALGAFDFHAERDTLEVQNDVGHVFANASNAGELVQHVVDLYGGDCGALKRRQQNATQRVAQRETKAALKRFGDNGRDTRRISARLDFKLCRLDQFCPVFVDHASLHSCFCPMSERQKRPRLK